MKENITKDRLISLLEKSRNGELARKYLAWSKFDKEDQLKLILIGSIVVEQKYNEEFQSKENYWSTKYPIAIEHYPYNGCDIYTDGEGYFFVYQEFGGHAPERRCRFILKELIV